MPKKAVVEKEKGAPVQATPEAIEELMHGVHDMNSSIRATRLDLILEKLKLAGVYFRSWAGIHIWVIGISIGNLNGLMEEVEYNPEAIEQISLAI